MASPDHPRCIHDQPFLAPATWRYLLFDWKGRLGRGRYWAAQGILLLLLAVFLVVQRRYIPPNLESAAVNTWLVFHHWSILLLSIKRAHDIGRSGWWAAVTGVPVLAGAAIVAFGLLPGQRGSNRFGPSPMGGDTSPDEIHKRLAAGATPDLPREGDRLTRDVLRALAHGAVPVSDAVRRDLQRQYEAFLALAFEGRDLDRLGRIPLPGLTVDVRPYLALADDPLRELRDLLARAPADPAGTREELERFLPAALWQGAPTGESAFAIVARRREEKFAEGRAAGHRWMLECRDLYDFRRGDPDDGVFFEFAATDEAARARVGELAADNANTCDALFDLALPLEEQGAGRRPEDWVAGFTPPPPAPPDG